MIELRTVLLCIFLPYAFVFASFQEPPRSKVAKGNEASREVGGQVIAKAKDNESLEQQRLRLTLNLDSLAQRGFGVEGEADRSRLWIRIGDAFWSLDKQRARLWFTRGFEEIDKISPGSDAERQRIALAINALRQDAVSRISKRDAALAAELMRKAPITPSTPAQKWRSVYGGGTAYGESLIQAAQKLLETDEKQSVALALRAIQDGLSQNLRLYLINLRAKDPSAADMLVVSALRQASSQHPGRLFDVLVLWEYVFQPERFYFGQVSWERDPKHPVYPTSTALRRTTLQFAVATINENFNLRYSGSASPADEPDPSVEPELLYSVIRQLLPIVEAELPAMSSALHTEMASLEEAIRSSKRALPDYVSPKSGPYSEPGKLADLLLDQAENVIEPKTRDELYYRAAYQSLSEGQYDKAADIASKIGDLDRRSSIMEPINFNKAGQLASSDDLEGALELSKRIENLEARVVVLATVFTKLIVRDQLRANEVAIDAEIVGGKAEPSSTVGSALLRIASAYLKRDRARAFEVLSNAVNVFNRAKTDDSFALLDGSGSQQNLKTTSLNLAANAVRVTYPRLAALGEVFVDASQDDFDEAIIIAQQLRSKALSLGVQVSICGASAESLESKIGRK